MKTLKELKENKEEITEKGPGLWANIRAKRQRIKSGSGERMRKPGEKGAPSPDALQKAKGTSEAATPAQQAAIAISMKKAGKKPKDMKEDEDVAESVKIIDRDSDLDQEHFMLNVNGKKEHFVHHNYENGHATDSKEEIHHQVKTQLKHLAPEHQKAVTNAVHASYRMKKTEKKKPGQDVAEASKPRTPTRDFLRRYPVPADQIAKPVKKDEKQQKKPPVKEEAAEEKYQEYKTGGKPLAKKFEKAFAKMGLKTNIKMKTVNNISVNEAVMKKILKTNKKMKEQAPTKNDNMKSGEALSGKKEPIEINPEVSQTK